jgi:DNA-binding beta-propeller fold protein YncE
MQRVQIKVSNASLIVIAGLVVYATCAGAASAQLLPWVDRRDHVFDPNTRILYITTGGGAVQRYDTVANVYLAPWTIGGDLGGLDVTPDGNTLLVCDRTYNTTTDLGQIHRVNVNTGAVTTLQYPIKGGEPTFTETGSWDVVALNNGKAFFNGDFFGTASVVLRELNLSTNAITDRVPLPQFIDVSERTWHARNASGSASLIYESDSSSGAVHSYNAATDSFVATSHLGFFAGEPWRSIFHTDGAAAVSRDGQRFAIEIEPTDELWIMDPSISMIHKKLPNIEGGVEFDPSLDLLYGLDIDTDQVVFYDATTFNEIKRIAAGGNLLATTAFDNGVTSLDPFESTLYVSTTGGILAIPNVPEPTTTALLSVSGVLLASMSRRRGPRLRPRCV